MQNIRRACSVIEHEHVTIFQVRVYVLSTLADSQSSSHNPRQTLHHVLDLAHTHPLQINTARDSELPYYHTALLVPHLKYWKECRRDIAICAPVRVTSFSVIMRGKVSPAPQEGM